jgi:hypothetical protein
MHYITGMHFNAALWQYAKAAEIIERTELDFDPG